MTKLPRNVKGKELIRVLIKLGFVEVGKRGGVGLKSQFIQNLFHKEL